MRRPGRRELGLLAASVGLTVLAAELAFRALGLSYPVFHRLEPLRGWAPRPGVEGVYMEEGRAHIAINREGFRDREHPADKPAGTVRIAVLGDSFTEAQGIPVEKTFWSVIDRRLESCAALGRNRAEILNFGVTGYGTVQELVTLRANVLAYEPDVVLLAFFAGNDVWNNERELDEHPDRIYAHVADGRVVIDDSNTRTWRFWLKAATRNTANTVVNASRVLQVARRAYYGVRQARKHERLRQATLFDPAAPQYAVLRAPEDAVWRRAWATTEALLRTMNSESAAAGAVFFLAVVSNPPQVYPDPDVRRAFAEALGVGDLDYPDRRLLALAEAEAFPAIALAPALRERADADGLFLHGFANSVPGRGHWNEAGHRVGGEIMADALCAELGRQGRKR